MNEQNKFEYTYSMPTEAERKEIASIRRQYEDAPKTTDGKLERVRKLDARVKNGATALSLACGIFGTLVVGGGMALVLEMQVYLWGILLGVVGLAPVMLAYPVYQWAFHRGKQKYGEEILRLTEELLQEE